MKDCCDCGRLTKKGYQLRDKFRCDQCHEDYIRRSTREETNVLPRKTDRHRKTKRGIYEP